LSNGQQDLEPILCLNGLKIFKRVMSPTLDARAILADSPQSKKGFVFASHLYKFPKSGKSDTPSTLQAATLAIKPVLAASIANYRHVP
jgi:hypothetical protein